MQIRLTQTQLVLGADGEWTCVATYTGGPKDRLSWQFRSPTGTYEDARLSADFIPIAMEEEDDNPFTAVYQAPFEPT